MRWLTPPVWRIAGCTSRRAAAAAAPLAHPLAPGRIVPGGLSDQQVITGGDHRVLAEHPYRVFPPGDVG